MPRLEDQFETVDGSRPDATVQDEAVEKSLPLNAFSVLSQGDVFDVVGGRPPSDGTSKARAYCQSHLRLALHGASEALAKKVEAAAVTQLSANPMLVRRLERARPIAVDLVPPGAALWKLGYPKAASPNVSGLFWDHPSWPAARIALRQEKLDDPTLVVHELAHAIHYLAFTAKERDAIYRLLLRTYRSRAAADEVFAIYSEREFVTDFSERERRAPGVYGMARQRWNEDHVFTRFVRLLYFPHKPLAGGTGRTGTSG